MCSQPYRSGRHFLHIPGPTPVPDRIFRAMSQPIIDHRSAEFAELGAECLAGTKRLFKMEGGETFIYPASGTGAWEAAFVNTLNAGDRVLMYETGHFSNLWKEVAHHVGLDPVMIPGDWRHGIDPAKIEAALREDKNHKIKAVCCVHSETSTGTASRIDEIRKAIDAVGHPALYFVDAVSSLGSMDFRHAGWGVDVAVASSQKGMMLPAGLAFNAVSQKALEASKTARLPRAYWSWEAMIKFNTKGFFPYTPAISLLRGLREALIMILDEEGLDAVFSRHFRLAEATRRAIAAWGLELMALDPLEFSNSVSAVKLPEGHDEVRFRKMVLERYDLSLGSGLSKLAGKVFRIGHLGSLNDLGLCAALSGVEMGLRDAGIPHNRGGVNAALDYLGSK